MFDLGPVHAPADQKTSRDLVSVERPIEGVFVRIVGASVCVCVLFVFLCILSFGLWWGRLKVDSR